MKSTTLFSAGYRPFFLFGALYAAALIAVWVPWFLGLIGLEVEFSPVSWHAHELLFGFVPAIVAGILPAALPSGTERPPLAGWPLAALFAVWIVGRLGVAGSAVLGPLAVALLTLMFPVAAAVVVGWEVAKVRNRRKRKVLGGLAALIGAQGLFHWELWHFGQSVHGTRLAVAAILALIMLSGRRIIPSVIADRLPSSPSRFDRVAMTLGFTALAAWTVHHDGVLNERLTGALLLAAGIMQTARLARWQTHRKLAEPLQLSLHAGYAFIPVGFLLAAWASLNGSAALESAALHAWTVGAIGGMALAVMPRVALSHSGRAFTASWPTAGICIAVMVALAASARIVAALDPQRTMLLMPLAGTLWVTAFLMFAVVYGRLLLTRRR